jgi:hypothetical protein
VKLKKIGSVYVGGSELKWIMSLVPCFKRNSFKVKSSDLHLVKQMVVIILFLVQFESVDMICYICE